MLKVNETPRRTSRNFNINNIKLENVSVPENAGEFENFYFSCDTDKIKIDSNVSDDIKLTYGMGKDITDLEANKKVRLTIDSKTKKDVFLNFTIDEENKDLITNIEIVAAESTKSNVYIKYNNEEGVSGFHSSVIKVFANNNSNVNVYIVNLFDLNVENFITIDGEIYDNAKVNYLLVDFGGKHSLTNLYSNLLGANSDNDIKAIYLGKEEQLIDLNYIAELRGEKSNIKIDVQGALKDKAKKHFKGTIDFKTGCKKAVGDENEFCMLLSDTARSLALPMLLCSEEDVEGNHSSAAGKIDEKELFYIMSRGFDRKDAMKLVIRAKFNEIIENINDEKIKQEIIDEMYKRLD